MRKYMMLAILVVLATAMIGMGTFAKWTDTEHVGVNIPTGVIALELGEGQPCNIELGELKPCWWRNATVELVPGSRNCVQTNPGELFVHLVDIKVEGCPCPRDDAESVDMERCKKGILDYLEFDLSYQVEGCDPVVVIAPDKAWKIKDALCKQIPIGDLAKPVTVIMSFHLSDDTPIWLGGLKVKACFAFELVQEKDMPDA
jgi:predicted ribosomally synthesized peptide with SipW-like signal peptide